MKNLIIGLLLLIGLSFNVNAGPTVAGYSFQPWIVPVAILAMIGNAEYAACNNEPYTLVKHADGKSNYQFDITLCEFDANPSAYKVQ